MTEFRMKNLADEVFVEVEQDKYAKKYQPEKGGPKE